MASKRKLEHFDPNKSDPDDLDYGAESSPRARPQGRSRKSTKSSPRKPVKRQRRERYEDSEEDVEHGSDDASEEEAEFSDSDGEPPTRNPRTGRSVRSVAKKAVKYEESDSEEIAATESDSEILPPSAARSKQSKQPAARKSSLIVKLKVPLTTEGGRTTRTRRGSRSTNRRAPTPQAPSAALTRRSSRLSYDEEAPLVALTDSGRHETVTRAGSATPEPSARRATRGNKGLKKPPTTSAIMEVSMEGSTEEAQQITDGKLLFSQQPTGAAEMTGAEKDGSHAHSTAKDTDDDIRMESVEEEADEQVVQESQPDPEDNEEDDEGPIPRSGRTLRTRHKASTTPPASQPPSKTRKSLRAKKPTGEQSSDFEPDAEGEAEEDDAVSESEDDPVKPGRGGDSSTGDNSQGGRRSGRLSRKPGSRRSRSRRHPSPGDEDLDPDEIADEAAELDEDARRNRRSRKRPSQRPAEINFEPNLRNRVNRPDYRIFRPELILPVDDDDAPPISAATPLRNRRGGGGQTYRSLFSTYGPFGGAGGPPPVLGDPHGAGAGAAGGVDSDSSDDEVLGRGGQQGVGGAVGMTPTSAFPKTYLPPQGMSQPQAHNNDPISGPGGGPPGLGKVKDKKVLADADPLGVDPNVTFDGVGGLDNHINQLKEMVALPLLYPEVFQRFHVTPPRGVLFHGPPGTGKTLLARALASSVSSHGRKVTFYMRKGADALSKWVGEAEKQLRLLFEEARKNQPSIIFFDEIDGLAPVRSSKQEQIHASIVATLLALMDGMDGRGQVIVIGATNRPDSVDPALRRPGRFDREFYFPLPDAAGRSKIIDIHTKGWDPPLHPEFRDELAELTRGYGGADLRALCTEAALNAVQGTYPQIYSSDEKLIIDPSTIKVLAKDFMISVNKIVPASERSAASGATPLKKDIEPLLRRALHDIADRLDEVVPRKRKATALEEAMYDDRDDEFGFQKEVMQRDFESSRIFRPRLLIRGVEGMGQQYLGAALLSKFEGLHVQNFDMANLLKDSTRSPEAAVVQMFEEVKRHKPSVIYIPNVNIWWDTLSDSVKRTFVGLLRSLPPADPVLLLGIMELQSGREKPDSQMLRDLFGYSVKNQYRLKRPDKPARREYFKSILDFISKPPTEFPEPGQRKKRKLAELPVAPPPPPPPGPSKAELKAQKKRDRLTLNQLKLHIHTVMEQIKRQYKKFRNPIVEEATIAYLYNEQDPRTLTTDLTQEQKQQQNLFRPYEIDKDEKGVPGLREVATQKFYYNLEIVTIEKRLANGYYKRPKDFLADIKRLAKDAKEFGDQDRELKATEMLTNVEVDIAHLEQSQPALCAECEAVYAREQERQRELMKKAQEAQCRGEDVPAITPNVPPPNNSATTIETSGPVVLGQEIPGRHLFLTPTGGLPQSNSWSTTNGCGSTPQTNGSTVPSRVQGDWEMYDAQTHGHDWHPQGHQYGIPGPANSQAQRPGSSHASAHIRLFSAGEKGSATNSAQKSSDCSSGPYSVKIDTSNGTRPRNHPNFDSFVPSTSGSQIPSTQPQSVQSHKPSSLSHSTHPSQTHQHLQAPQTPHQPPPSQLSHNILPPPRHSNRSSSLHSILSAEKTDDEAAPEVRASPYELILDVEKLRDLQENLVEHSSGLSLEQLEQVRASMMHVIWNERGNWNRNHVWALAQTAFNKTIKDIQRCQKILRPSQEDADDDADTGDDDGDDVGSAHGPADVVISHGSAGGVDATVKR